jgi:miniconductance mechanosensitive channel
VRSAAIFERFDWSWFTEHPVLTQLIGLGLLLLLCWIVDIVTRRGLVALIIRLARRSRSTWDDILVEEQVFRRLAHLVPAIVAFYGVQFIPGVHPMLAVTVQRVALSLMILFGALAIGAFLTGANRIYTGQPEYKHRPIKGYVQVLKIILYTATALLVIATLLDRSPLIFLSGIGAMTAILLLIFKDTILGLVASVQLTNNKMIQVGDWIEMPHYGADGDVIDIALHTVKVQNWDKTITTIPTHKLITESFKNWRGMQQSGGRRIKREFYIDLNSVRFLEPDEIERFSTFRLLEEYIASKQDEIAESNARIAGDSAINADIRRMTNLGTLRAYIVSYLRQHSKVHQGLTQIVRQRDPTPEGLPMEIYAFTDDTDWVNYEGIQSDIFDHILAIIPEFGLRLFQAPSGRDLRALGSRSQASSQPH